MGKEVKVTCDGCGHDITTRSNSVDYRLVLAAESKPGYGAGVYTDMMIYPPIDRAYYFCRLRCLDHWRNREHHRDNLWQEWWRKWEEDNCLARRADGTVSSFTSPPNKITDARKTEFAAAALAAFPMQRLR